MKIKKVPLKTYLWFGLETDCPYKALEEIFKQIEPMRLEIMLRYYVRCEFVNDKSSIARPANSMYYTGAINSLVMASYMIYLNRKIYYTKKRVKLENFKLNPLELNYLSKSECINPYLAIDEVFENTSAKKLETLLFEMLSVSLGCFETAQLEIYEYMLFMKAVEACWLINERLKEKG